MDSIALYIAKGYSPEKIIHLLNFLKTQSPIKQCAESITPLLKTVENPIIQDGIKKQYALQELLPNNSTINGINWESITAGWNTIWQAAAR